MCERVYIYIYIICVLIIYIYIIYAVRFAQTEPKENTYYFYYKQFQLYCYLTHIFVLNRTYFAAHPHRLSVRKIQVRLLS